jgi:hypothetical protein
MGPGPHSNSVDLSLSEDDLALLLDALDSHEYWQLGDILPRNNGEVWIPGDSVDEVDRYWADDEPSADQEHAIEAVRRCRALSGHLRAALRG